MTASEVLATARREGRVALTEIEAKDLLRAAGIPTVDTRLARDKTEAQAIARNLGFPVALKILSPQILHKSDIGGVKLGLQNEDEVAAAFESIMASARQHEPSATIDGVAVQPMARPGTEVILGLFKDQQFGPVLMFGLGGIFVEVLKDVAFRIVPLERRDAREMIREIKGYPLLEGYRGQEPADVAYLEELLLKLSHFAEEHPEVREVDLNPVFAYRDGALAVDARVVLEQDA
jgi:acyl-CoA synthetase (NDP forming)